MPVCCGITEAFRQGPTVLEAPFCLHTCWGCTFQTLALVCIFIVFLWELISQSNLDFRDHPVQVSLFYRWGAGGPERRGDNVKKLPIKL